MADVRVERLELRIPARDADEGRRRASAVADEIGRVVGAGATPRWTDLNLRVELPEGASQAALTRAVRQALQEALR
jgi:hypothetical protein